MACREKAVEGITSTAGAADTNKVVMTDADGLIDATFLTERVEDIVGAQIDSTTSITWTYNDTTGALTGVITDRDYGDITVSSTGATWTIDNSAVTYAKIQNVSATDKILGRATAGAGVVEEIACTAAGRALLDDADAAAQRTTLNLGTMAVEAEADYGALADDETVTGAWTFDALLTADGGIATTTFSSSGHVGVGTTASYRLHVADGASGGTARTGTNFLFESGGNTIIQILGAGTNSAIVAFGNATDGDAAQVGYTEATPDTGNPGLLIGTRTANGELIFRTGNNTTTAILDSAGAYSVNKSLLVNNVNALTAVSSGSQTRTIDLTNGSVQTITANQTFTLNASGPAGQAGYCTLFLYNSTVGAFNATFGTGWWTAGAQSLTASSTRMMCCFWDGTRMWIVNTQTGSGDLRPS